MPPDGTMWRVLEALDRTADEGDASVDGSATQLADAPPSVTDVAAAGSLLSSEAIRWLIVAAVAGIAAVVVAVVLLASAPRSSGAALGSLGPDASDGTLAGSGDLVVEVGGAVVRPGLYRLPAGSRVADAISAAGGFSARVDAARADQALNLASALTDGLEVHVPSRDDPSAPSDPSARGSGPSGPININTATVEQLDTLPGIGPVTAAKIVAARQQQPFRSVDDLQSRKLVGPSTFDKIKALVAVR